MRYFWRVSRDPAIRDCVFNGDWRVIDGFITTPQLRRDVTVNEDCAWLAPALARSRVVARFDTGDWPVEVRAAEGDQSLPEIK